MPQLTVRRQPVDSHGQTHETISIGEILNSRPDTTLFKTYDNMLRAFYNEHLQIDGGFMSNLQEAWTLTTLAEEYGAVKTVSERVEVALLRHGQSLFQAIANNSVAWMNFACTIHSEVIFRNSLIHVVGRWDMAPERKQDITAPGALEVCERKYQEFRTLKQAIEIRIAGHYPEHMHKKDEANPGRAQYANDIYAWVALSLFRHWFAQNVTDGTSFRAADGGFQFYSLVARAGKAYLDKHQLETFHIYFPMTHKAKLVLENYLNVLKSEAQQFVMPLMKNNTDFDLGEGESFNYLVSLDVKESDMPWKAQSGDEVPRPGLLPSRNGL